MKFSIKDFLSKCDQIRRKLQIWSHLLKKYLMENSIYLCSEIKRKPRMSHFHEPAYNLNNWNLKKNCGPADSKFIDHLQTFFSFFKGALPGLRQLLETESFLKLTKNAFYFTLKSLFKMWSRNYHQNLF